MWRAATYPDPGFEFYQLDDCVLLPDGTDPADLYNASFRIDGEEIVTCPWDCAGGDGIVGIVDFLLLLSQWGMAGSCDFDGCGVSVTDFLDLLAHWGNCP